MQQSFARSAIVLGLLTAVGPFAIDMYLPALTAIAADFGTTDAGAQATLIGYFLAVALCQIVYGPISDSFGRKPPLYFGMALYAIGALGCVAPESTSTPRPLACWWHRSSTTTSRSRR